MATSTTTSTTTITTTTTTTTTVELRDTQIAIEVLETDANPELWNTQIVVEALETDANPELWDTQIAIEVLERVLATTTTTSTTTQTESPDESGEWFTDFREYPVNRVPHDWSQGENADKQVAIVEALSGAVGGKVLTFFSDCRTAIINVVRSFLWDTPGSSDGTVEVVAKIREMQLSSTGRSLSLSLRDDPDGDKRYIVEARYLVNDIILTSGTDSWTTIENANCGSISDKTWYRMRVRIVEYPSYVHIRAKVWADIDSEPGSWQIDYADTAQLQTGAGKVGVALGLEAYKLQVDWFSVAYGGATAKLPDELPTTSTSTTTSTTSHTTTTIGHEYVTDFTGYPIGEKPSDWTEGYGSADSVLTVNHSGQIGPANKALEVYHELGATPSINWWDVVPDLQNVEVLLKMMIRAGSSHPGRLTFHADSSGNAYSMHLASVTNKFYISRYVAGAHGPMEDQNTINISPDEWIWVRGKITTMKTPYDAVRVRAKAWLAGSAETTEWDFDAVVRQTPVFTDAGKVGLGNYLSGNYILCDYFHVASGGIEPQWGSTTTTTTEHFYETDFNEYSAGSPPSDWTETWNTADVDTTVETGGGNKVLTLDISSNAKIAASWDDIGSDKATAEVLGSLRTDDGFATLATGLGLRLSGGVGTETGYVAHLDLGNDQLTLRRHNSGVSATLATGSKTLAADTWYWVRLRAEGSVLKVRAWASDAAEPGTWDIDHTDTSPVSSGGEAGVCTFNASGEADYFALESDSAQWPIPVPTLGTTTTGTTTTYDVWATDFSEYTVDQSPPDWDEDWGGGYGARLVQNAVKGYGGQRLNIDSPSSSGRYGLSWDDPGDVRDVEVLARIRNTDGGEQGQRIAVRAKTSADETGYFASIDPVTTGYGIFKYVAGDSAILITDNVKTVLPDIYYWMRFRVVGPALKFKFWAGKPVDEPAGWDLEITDGTIIDSGWVGVSNYTGDTIYDVDWFSVVDASGGGSAPFPTSGFLSTTTTSTTHTTTTHTTTTTTTAATTTTTTCVWDDDFTGSDSDPPDPDKWTETGSPDIQGNELELSVVGSGTEDKVTLKGNLTGDFDVQVDFDLYTYSLVEGSGADLHVLISEGYEMYLRRGYAGGDRYQRGYKNGGGWNYTPVSTSDDTGKLRITRTGSTWHAYYYNAGWIEVGSGISIGVGAVQVWLTAANWTGDPDLTWRADNFTINAGCPGGIPGTTTTTSTTSTTTTELPDTYWTNFSEHSEDAIPSDWTEVWELPAAELTVRGEGQYGSQYLEVDHSTFGHYFAEWDDVATAYNTDILAKVKFGDEFPASGEDYFKIVVRQTGGNTDKNGYELRVRPDDDEFVIYNWVSNVASQIGATGSLAIGTGWYWIRFQAIGNIVKARIWAGQPSDEPAGWDINVTNSDHYGVYGTVGVGSYTGDDTRVDYFGVGVGGSSAPAPVDYMTTSTTTTTTTSTTTTGTTETPMEPAHYISIGALQRS